MTNLPPSESAPQNSEKYETPEQSLYRLTAGVDALIEGYRGKYPGPNRPMSGYRYNVHSDGSFDEEISGLTDTTSHPYWLKRTVNAEGQATFRLATAFGGPRNEIQRSWDLISPTIHELTADGEEIDRSVSPEDIRDLTAALDLLDPSRPPEPKQRRESQIPELSNRERNKAIKELKREFAPSQKRGSKVLRVIGIKKP